MVKAKTTYQFIQEAQQAHVNNYDYRLVRYHNAREKVCIICNQCFINFWQKPNHHLYGHRCPTCGGSKKKSKQEFIQNNFSLVNLNL